ncbi:MAG: hypothetical protein DRO88_00970 [Promethearchaeia archaeon]|nr:MAG: hypothetical protein DRO88_00970 [Candidatus Lokiarchaeia archaeon]
MYQINFRVKEEEKAILEKIAKIEKISLAELSKRLILKELNELRIKIAFDLMGKGKIGKKIAWKMSGLSYYEFLKKINDLKITEKVSEEVMEKEIAAMNQLDYKELLKSSFEEIDIPLL